MDEKETINQIAQRMLDSLNNQKAFVLAKVETMENRIAENGGSVPQDLAQIIAAIRAAAK